MVRKKHLTWAAPAPTRSMIFVIAYMIFVPYISFIALGWPGGRLEQDHGTNRIDAD